MRARALTIAVWLLALPAVAGCGDEREATPRTPVLGVDSQGNEISPEALRVIDATYRALAKPDYARLRALCGECTRNTAYAESQEQMWRQGDIRTGLLKVLRQAHAAPTDGEVTDEPFVLQYTYPGFVLTGIRSDEDIADAEVLGVRFPVKGGAPGSAPFRGPRIFFLEEHAAEAGTTLWSLAGVGEARG